METYPNADNDRAVARNNEADEVDPASIESSGDGSAENDTEHDSAGGDELAVLATHAQRARLTAAEEERAIALLKESMREGKNGIARVTETLPGFPWIVAVRGIETVWPELKTTARAQFIKGLSEQEGEGARRIRLSLARALFKQDVPTALKIACAVAKQMVKSGGETIALPDAHIFSNVFIGKAKPWISQLSLDDLKPGDADVLVQCAVAAAFAVSHPPSTQLGILKWAADAGKLEKLDDATLQSIIRATSRWSGKWRTALLTEIPSLPEQITSALQKEENAALARPRDRSQQDEQAGETAGSPTVETDAEKADAPPQERKERPVYQPRPQKTAPTSAPRHSDALQRERPVYQPRAGASSGRDLNVSEMVRQIEAHVAWLRSELQTAQSKLREDAKQGRRSKGAERASDFTGGSATFEELARTNVQLEARIADLQTRIQDLLADAEDRAASMQSPGGDAEATQDGQLRALLALKLQESFADFSALEKESPSVVVQQHYRSLLQEVFGVLRHEGVRLDAPS